MAASNGIISRPILDTHFHIWYMPGRMYTWPTADLTSLTPETTIEEYEQSASQCNVTGAIFVQVLNDCPEEIDWVAQKADSHSIIKGIIGGIDLSKLNVTEVLERYVKQHGRLLVGVRHILDMENDAAAWLLSENIVQGMTALQKHDLTFDLLLRPHLIKPAIKFVDKYPKVKFVVDHMAKPYIAQGLYDEWAGDMEDLSKHRNVYCKISGLVVEADYQTKSKEEISASFVSYVKHILVCFGIDRVMFGSNWPVCRLAGWQYQDDMQAIIHTIKECGLSEEDQEKLFYKNAKHWYNVQN